MTSGGFRITRPDSDQLLSETADKITQIFLKNIEAVKVRRRLHDSFVKKTSSFNIGELCCGLSNRTWKSKQKTE